MVFDSTMTTLLRTGLRITGLELGSAPDLSEGRRQELAQTFGNGQLVLVDVDVDPDGFVSSDFHLRISSQHACAR